MHADFTAAEIAEYTARQLNAFFPDPRPLRGAALQPAVDETFARLERCFRAIALPLYRRGDQPRFDLYHSDQYCTYLGYLGNALWRAEADPSICSRVFALNKALHGFNCMYDNPLPDVVVFVHVVGTVLGKAVLPNYLAVMQGVTIGAIGGVYPTLSPGLVISAGASIIGACTIGRNVMLEPHAHVLKTDVPDDVRVGGPAPHRFSPQNDAGLRFFFHLDDPTAARP
jgi:serine O-acetyltransferase